MESYYNRRLAACCEAWYLLKIPKQLLYLAYLGSCSIVHLMVQTTDASPSDIGVGPIAQAALDLETQGWAVVPDVLSTVECEEYVSGAWTWLESLDTGIKRDDPATWGDDRWPSSFRGIINTLEVSHQDFVWRVRQNPRILQVGEA